jgi:sterol 3beta-glucosyltransferase
MRITILTLGSQGDVQPYVALGTGLTRAGHRVRVVTFQNFRGLVEGAGLDFHAVKGDSQAILSGVGGIGEGSNNPIRLFSTIKRSFATIAQDYADAFSADILFDSEAIINQLPGSLFGYDLAEKLRIPHIAAAVMPLSPTRQWPLCMLPAFSIGGVYNRLTYQLGEQLVWSMFRRPINRFRAKLGLRPAPFWGNFGQIRAEHMPIVNGFSAEVVPRPPDWGEHIHITGYWLLDEPDWTPPQELLDFLNAGAPPVFIGFGSMPVRDPQQLTHTIVQALERSGQRGVLSAGWAGIAEGKLPDTIFKTGYAPYTWLLPRMAAVVHHGGSGTTGLGLRSGVPSLIVPFGADQFYWGARTHALGVAPTPIPFKRLSAENLADAIRVMVTNEPMRQRAGELGTRLQAEDGIGNSVQIINHLLHHGIN